MTTMNKTETRPLSITQMRKYISCSYAYYLRYERGVRPQVGAGALFGRTAHEAIQLGYTGIPLDEAYERAWQPVLGPMWDQANRLLELDAEYAAQGSSRTKAAKQWLQDNPDYERTAAAIDEHGEQALPHIRWGKRGSLSSIFRRGAAMRSIPETDIFVPRPILVEGMKMDELRSSLDESTGDTFDRLTDISEEDEEDDPKPRDDYRLLRADLDGLEICGVPDVVALADGDAQFTIADYKTGKRHMRAEELREDAQVILYRYLLEQNGIISRQDRVRFAHGNLNSGGDAMTWVFADDGFYETGLERLRRQADYVSACVDAGLFQPVKGLNQAMSPCHFCDVAHKCDA
jgi:hypothetical protein